MQPVRQMARHAPSGRSRAQRRYRILAAVVLVVGFGSAPIISSRVGSNGILAVVVIVGGILVCAFSIWLLANLSKK